MRDFGWEALLKGLRDRPGMYTPGGDFNSVAAMILGYSLAKDDQGPLLPYIEKLADSSTHPQYVFTVHVAAKTLNIPVSKVRLNELDEEQDRKCTRALCQGLLDEL